MLGQCWHTAPGVDLDTEVEPQWQRTGYRYFPYAAVQAGRWWVIRVNYCFPEHDFATLFIDGVAVAEATAVPNDVRPLVASIGRLPLTDPSRAGELPEMSVEVARQVVEAVAAFINHGSEWGDPCGWCEFAQRDPLRRAAG